MGSRYEVEVMVTSAKDLKNVNWRYGPLKPYAVLWVDPKAKCSTRVDDDGDTSPYWDETVVIPFDSPLEDSTLHIDVVHAKASDDTKPLIGTARLRLIEVVDQAGLGARVERKLELRRPSGRPHGKLQVQVNVREPPRYRAPDPYYAPPYGVPPPGSRDFSAPPQPYGNPAYGAPPASAYAAPPAGYPYSAPAAPPPSYGQPSYGQPAYGQPSYGQPAYGAEKKKSKFGGMGTGLAVGAVAGALGGLALAEGIDHVEDKIADDAAEKVEDDQGYDDDDADGW